MAGGAVWETHLAILQKAQGRHQGEGACFLCLFFLKEWHWQWEIGIPALALLQLGFMELACDLPSLDLRFFTCLGKVVASNYRSLASYQKL
jgi:hypothetical protein